MALNAAATTVHLDRDSVCAGDDTDSHAVTITMPHSASITDLLERVARGRFLASISGGEATWLITLGQNRDAPIGVMAQQWERPRLTVSKETPLSTLFTDREPRVYFRYWVQVDPDLVFDCLRSGKELPAR